MAQQITHTNEPIERTQRSRLWKFLMKVLNPLVKFMLRSPLHVILSSSYMLITVTGRKSGRHYTTPVQYKLEGDTVYIITFGGYTWWKNLRGGAPVDLLIRGKNYHGQATTSTDSETIKEVAKHTYPKMTEAQFNKMMTNTVAITIALESHS